MSGSAATSLRRSRCPDSETHKYGVIDPGATDGG